MTGAAQLEIDAVVDVLQQAMAPAFDPVRADASAEAGWDAEIWAVLTAMGLTTLAADPDVDGTSALRVGVEVAVQAGRHAVFAPFSETQVAGWLCRRLGVAPPEGPLSVSLAPPTEAGVLMRVPYGRVAAGVLAPAGDHGWRLVGGPVAIVRRGTNLAGEPRDDLQVNDSAVIAADASTLSGAATLMRTLRTAQILGSAQRCLDLTVSQVTGRVQFGRPLSGFQSVQHQVAVLGSEVALMRAAVDAACAAIVAWPAGHPGAEFAASCAKGQVSLAAVRVARIAHQLHGAMGTTREHRLRLATTRLWAWADEDGAPRELLAAVGETVLTGGPDQLWRLLTDWPAVPGDGGVAGG